jgi:hypothetical protein
MTLGHPRLTLESRDFAGSISPSEFDPVAMLERLGPGPEASLGKALHREYQSLSRESDPELFWEGTLRIANRLEQENRLEASSALYQGIALGAAAGFPELSRRAERGLKAITGEGENGARFEFLLRRFVRETGDPTAIASFGAGSIAYQAAKLSALSGLNAGVGSYLGRKGAELVAAAAGLSVEAPVFLFASKLGRELHGPQDWRAETLAHELAGIGLTLGTLKGSGALSRSLAGANPFAQAALPQAGMLSGILLAHRGEEMLGLRPQSSDATLFADSLTTYFQFLLGGKLAERALGPRFRGFQTRLKSSAENLGRPALPISSPVFAASSGSAPGRSISLQDLLQKPLQSGSYDDDSGVSNPTRYGYGKDTVMNMWFPEKAKPSSAIPIFTTASEQIVTKLRSAYRNRPDREHTRTVLLEPGTEALQKIAPKAVLTTDTLNELTRMLGDQFPEKTPFRIMEVGKRRTFTAKVTDRKIRWTEVEDPLWGGVNRHAGTSEFEASTPLEIYLYIESLTRQPKPNYQTDYRVRYLGSAMPSFEITAAKFFERSLRLYRPAGRSFTIETADGETTLLRYTTPNNEWNLEKIGYVEPSRKSTPSPIPPAVTGQAAEPTARLTPLPARKPLGMSPFAVVNSLQGLKDIAGLLSHPSLPRRIELWYESSTPGEKFHADNWQKIFRDLRAGSILVVNDQASRKSHTFQRHDDQIMARSSRWSPPLAWEPGIPLSSRDVMDLLSQMQFMRGSPKLAVQSLVVSVLGDWDPSHGKMLINQVNQWSDLPFDSIEIRASRPRTDVWLRLRRNFEGKFESFD